MKIIAKPRRDGKTTELIKLSAETNTYILVANKMRQKEVIRLADLMNITIPYPVTVEDYMRTRFRGSFIKNILIDDADDVLQAFFYTVAIDAITVTIARTSCKDCIGREDAINVVHKYFVNYLKLNDDICLDGIRSLSSVTPSRPKGKWIDDNCSICGYGIKAWNNTPYCPNCGADMRESEEEEWSQ